MLIFASNLMSSMIKDFSTLVGEEGLEPACRQAGPHYLFWCWRWDLNLPAGRQALIIYFGAGGGT